MDLWATKDHYERETEEAERLVRESPKVKPPRHDRRREDIHERDPDIDDDPDVAKDKDLSLNHKTIGGSIVERVVERHLGVDPIALRVVERVRRADINRSKLITVRLKENPEKTVQVSEETLKKEPGKYEPIKDEEKEKPAPKKEKKPAPKKPDAAEEADDEEARAELEEKRKERERAYGGGKKDEPLSEWLTGQLESGATTEGDQERREKKQKEKEQKGGERPKAKPADKPKPEKSPQETPTTEPEEAPKDEKPGLQEGQPAAEEEHHEEEDEATKKQREADEKAFEAGETIRELAGKDEWLRGIVDSVAKRNGPLGKRLRKNPHESLKSILGARFTHERWPKDIQTLGDLHRALTTEKPGAEEETLKDEPEKPSSEEPSKEPEAPGEPAKPEQPQIPAPKREPASAAEVRRATDYIKRTLPAADAEMLLASGIHPKDVNTLAATYEAAKAKKVDAKNVSKFAESLAGHFQPDPERVPPPKTWIKEGTEEEVPFDSLSPEEQAEAWQEHKMNVAALSIAGRQKVLAALQGAGLPEPLAMQVGKFLLSKGAGSDRMEEAEKASEDLFTKHVAYGRATRPVPDDRVASILRAITDPAARKVAAAYLQSQDYLSARNRFLTSDSEERISEHEPPQTIAANIAKATKYLKDRARLYEGVDTGNVDAAAIFRARVEEQLRTLDPEKWAAVEPKLRQLDAEDYEERAREYKTANAAYEKARAQIEAELNEHHPAAEERFDEGGERQEPGTEPGGGPYRSQPMEHLVEERLAEMGVTKPREPIPPPGYTPKEEGEGKGKKTPKEKAKALWDRFFSRGKSASQLSCHWRYPRIVYDVVSRWAGYSSYPRGWTMGDLSADPVRSAVRASMKRHGVYWGVQENQGGDGFPPYAGWQQAHARDLNDSDYDGILRAAREWLRMPILGRKVEGLYRDTQIRAALDLALRDHESGRYSVGLHPTVYNHLLARLAGQSENDTLLTERKVEGIREASKSTYGDSPGEVSTMKASVHIRQFAARVASSNPELAYDLIALASTVEAGEVPPQFKEHMKEKGDGQGQGQDQGQKDASVKLANLRSLVINTAAQHPEAREVFLPILNALKNG